MNRQKSAFLDQEANSYFERNAAKLSDVAAFEERDPVLAAIAATGFQPKSVLEIGAANGIRLAALADRYGSHCAGVDPSQEAVDDGKARFPDIELRTGTAEHLEFPDGKFDMVIFGFCLYLCDREDLFRIAAETDRVLADEGHVAILDFCTPFPYRNTYGHFAGLFSYKMDYSRLFTWNPAYDTVYTALTGQAGDKRATHVDGQLGTHIIRKRTADAYPLDPFKK